MKLFNNNWKTQDIREWFFVWMMYSDLFGKAQNEIPNTKGVFDPQSSLPTANFFYPQNPNMNAGMDQNYPNAGTCQPNMGMRDYQTLGTGPMNPNMGMRDYQTMGTGQIHPNMGMNHMDMEQNVNPNNMMMGPMNHNLGMN